MVAGVILINNQEVHQVAAINRKITFVEYNKDYKGDMISVTKQYSIMFSTVIAFPLYVILLLFTFSLLDRGTF